MRKGKDKRVKSFKAIASNKMELSYSHITSDEKGLLGVIVAAVGPAKGHECNYEGEEYQVWADEETLQAWESLSKVATKRLYVRIDHTNQPFSKIGYLTNLRLQGVSLIGDIELADVAFTPAMGNKGQAVIDIAKGNDPELICLSLECQGAYVLADSVEPGELQKRAYIRPTILLGVAFVNEGALTEKLFAYSQKLNGDINVENKEIKADEVKQVTGEIVAITAIQGEPAAATVEVKLDAAPTTADAVPAVELSADPAVDADAAADNALSSKLDAAIAAIGHLSTKIDALATQLQSMDMDDEASDDDLDMANKKATADEMLDAHAALKAAGVEAIVLEAKPSEKKSVIQVLAAVPEESETTTTKNGEPTLADLANPANRRKYWKKYKEVIIDLEYKSRKKDQ